MQPIIDAIDAEFEKGKPSMSFGQICHYEGSFGGTIKFGLFKQAEAFAVLEAEHTQSITLKAMFSFTWTLPMAGKSWMWEQGI